MRARNIKPRFFRNAYLSALSEPAQLLYIGLWCMADCEGKMKDRPADIKAEVFPHKNHDIEQLLSELCTAQVGEDEEPFIIRYKVGRTSVIKIPTFHLHQNPHRNEKPLGLPEPVKPESEGVTEIIEKKPEHSSILPEQYASAPAESLLLNPESPTPKPERGGGVFFEIKNRGVETTEDNWIHNCLLQLRRSKGQSTFGCDTLMHTRSLYPDLSELVRRWLIRPTFERMAAYAYTVIEQQPDNQFKYALAVIEKALHKPELQKYLTQARADVAKQDYKVTI